MLYHIRLYTMVPGATSTLTGSETMSLATCEMSDGGLIMAGPFSLTGSQEQNNRCEIALSGSNTFRRLHLVGSLRVASNNPSSSCVAFVS